MQGKSNFVVYRLFTFFWHLKSMARLKAKNINITLLNKNNKNQRVAIKVF